MGHDLLHAAPLGDKDYLYLGNPSDQDKLGITVAYKAQRRNR
jgi:hypothetical protein